MSLGSAIQASAVGFDETFYSGNDILFYDPRASDCSEGSTELIGSDNFEKIWNYFIGKGLTPQAVAGILGNIKQESGGDPEILQGGGRTKDPSGVTVGWGLIQWTPGKKVLGIADEAGITGPIYELSTQVEIVWWHMNNTSPTGVENMISSYKTIDDVAEATRVYEEKMEAAGDPQMPKRIAYAQDFYEKYGGNTSGSSESSSCGDLSAGKGNFTDSGEVAGYSTVLANAQYADGNYDNAFYQKGVCAAITSVVWHGNLTAYGYHTAIDLWNTRKNSDGHVDRSPRKGALLLYSSTSQPAGHVVIYLGNNKVLNDGKIDDAIVPEKSWDLKYEGWIDPNDIGWSTESIDGLSADEIKSWMRGNGLSI